MAMDQRNRIVKMILEYDGTNYAGWQRQRNSVSVQETVEVALEQYLGMGVRVTASGRTDAGVHAMGQVISFVSPVSIPAAGMGRGLMRYLPRDISVVCAEDAPVGFDARRSARMRWYRFFLTARRGRAAVARDYLTPVAAGVDVGKMRAAAAVLAGEHDFSAFRSVACTATRTVLTLQPIEITQLPGDVIQLDFRCRSFLQNMVRILTGTLVAAGMGKLDKEDIEEMLRSGVRHRHAVTVPPNGLFLWGVSYEESGTSGTD